MPETQNLLIADRIRDVAEFLIFRGLFLIFLFALYRAAFYCVLASVCEVKRSFASAFFWRCDCSISIFDVF